MFTTPLLSVLLLCTGAWAGDAPADPGLVPSPRPIALLHAWVTLYDMDQQPQADPASYGDPEDDSGMKIRRARLGFTGASDLLEYAFSVGVAAPYDSLTAEDESVEIVDAFMGWAPVKDFWLQAGLAKVPVSREQLISSSRLPLAERSVASEWLVPGREAGLTLDWRTRGDTRLRARAGIYNGNGDMFRDNNNGKLVAARVEFATGPAGTYRTWGPEKGFTLGVGADGYLNTDVSTTTAAVGADMMMRVAGAHLMVEGRLARLSPRNTDIDQPGVFATTSRWGGLAEAGYGIGRVEPVVRFSLFDDNTATTDNGDIAELLGGVSYHLLEDRARVGGGYVMRMERGGATLPNDTVRLWMTFNY